MYVYSSVYFVIGISFIVNLGSKLTMYTVRKELQYVN